VDGGEYYVVARKQPPHVALFDKHPHCKEALRIVIESYLLHPETYSPASLARSLSDNLKIKLSAVELQKAIEDYHAAQAQS
jgi:hypothetical protein